MLISDGHKSHNHLEFVEKAREENIILVELPSKTSNWTQPFDRSVFKSLKSHWNDSIDDFTAETGVAVCHGQFFRLFRKSWSETMSRSNIRNGFVATCPYNPGIIPNEAYMPSELYDATEESDPQPTSTPEETSEPQDSSSEMETLNASVEQSGSGDPVFPVVPELEENVELVELQDSMLLSLDIYSTCQLPLMKPAQ